MVEGPVSNRRFSRRQIRSLVITVGGVITALVIVVGGWQIYSNSRIEAAAKKQRQLEDFAEKKAREIGTPFTRLEGQLDALSKDPELIALFSSGDTDKLKSAAARYVGQFSDALNIRFLLPGNYALDNNSVPPLSYASLDLLHRAESSNTIINAEVHLYGGPKQHIVMLKRVKNAAGELIGIIHLSLSVDLFDQALAGLKLNDVYLELRQAAGGKELLLGKGGEQKIRTGEPAIIPLAGTRWTVALWTRSGGLPEATGASPGMVVAGLLLLILLVAGAAVVFIVKRPKSSSPGGAADVLYAGAVHAIMHGAHPGMEKMVPDLPACDGNESMERSAAAVEEGEDVTMMIKTEDLQQAAAATDVFDLTQEEEPAAPAAAGGADISAEIFRTYDIRGIAGDTLTVETVGNIGRAIGSEAGSRGQTALVVGRDGRISSPELAEALISGLRDSGRDVIDIGMVPTPVLYFATHFLEIHSGVMLTGSHNEPEYNGLKIVLNDETLSEDAIQSIYQRIKENNYESGQGTVQSREIIADYVRRISEDIPVALGGAFKIVVDCGNGVAATVAPQLLRALGHDVVELYCEVDGNFPNHQPDPSQPENMQELIAKLKEEQADLGFAFDGDGDRLGVVDNQANIIWPDRQLMLLAKDVLSRNQGKPIIFDVKCSRYLKAIIESNGGRPLMWKTGHSLIKRKMKEVDAPLAGEMSGHVFFKERWYGFDDAIYTAARLLEVLMNAGARPAEVFAEMPEGVSTPELRIDLPEAAHQSFMQDLQDKMTFDGAEIIDIDGYRVEFADGWGLIRPSNTTPCLVLRFEAESQSALERIQEEFRKVLRSINSDLQLPF